MNDDTIESITKEILTKAGIESNDRSLFSRREQSDALEYLVNLIAIRRNVHVDQKAHINRLINIAKESVARVKATGQAESLIPMNAFDRLIIHTELAQDSDVKSESIGVDPNRRIVIKPASLL